MLLYTLDFPISDELLGDVWVYPLTERFDLIWERLAKQWDKAEGFRTPHGSLRVALSVVNGSKVIFVNPKQRAGDLPWSQRSLLVTDRELNSDLTTICFDTWQRRNFPDMHDLLSDQIDFVGAKKLELASLLERDEHGYVTGPWWWKDAAGWAVAGRLVLAPLVETVPVQRTTKFQMTTNGHVLSWNEPLERVIREDTPSPHRSYGMTYMTVEGANRRDHRGPVARIDCHVTRVADRWANVKTVRIKHPKFDQILHIPVFNRKKFDRNGDPILDAAGKEMWETVLRGSTAEIVEACGLETIRDLPQQANGQLELVRGIYRPNNDRHLIGKGTGSYFTLRFGVHASKVLGVEPFLYEKTIHSIPGKTITSGAVPATSLPKALAAAGWKGMRIIVLYQQRSTPRRLLKYLNEHYQVPTPLFSGQDEPDYHGLSLSIGDAIEVVLLKVPELVMHGSHDRKAVIGGLDALNNDDPDTLRIALCETVWNGKPIADDGKPQTRRALGTADVVSQFLVAKEPPEGDDEEDFPVTRAFRDLLRAGGVLDDRLTRATYEIEGQRKSAPQTKPVATVGIHIRRHTYRRVKGQPKRNPRMVVQMIAMHFADGTVLSPPRTEMYSNGEWVRHAEGVARFHAGPIGTERFARSGEAAEDLRDYIETALNNLILPDGCDRVVIFLDKESARSIYAGIDDNPTVKVPLPGQQLRDDDVDVAVVRIALDGHAPRPATPFREGKDDLETMTPTYRKTVLFASTSQDEVTYLLTHPSRQHEGAMSPLRAGTKSSRPDFDSRIMGKDMHATGRIEFAVPQAGSWDPAELAIFTARLCVQSTSTDDRTRWPEPLHFASAADKDHPEYGDHEGEE
jgi:hypothetical protein